MPTITRFEEIEAWQTARELTKLIYALTGQGGICPLAEKPPASSLVS